MKQFEIIPIVEKKQEDIELESLVKSPAFIAAKEQKIEVGIKLKEIVVQRIVEIKQSEVTPLEFICKELKIKVIK